MPRFDVQCDYGGLGNYQEHDTKCMLCPHEDMCIQERELASIGLRERSVGSGWRSPSYARRALSSTQQRSRTGIQPAQTSRFMSTRPMPEPGESPMVRFAKNVTMSGLAAVFHEAGCFCEQHDMAPSINPNYIPRDVGAEKSAANTETK